MGTTAAAVGSGADAVGATDATPASGEKPISAGVSRPRMFHFLDFFTSSGGS